MLFFLRESRATVGIMMKKVGFCICFTLKNHEGRVIACGMSPPILITDDHKSSKAKAATKAAKRPRKESLSPRRDSPQAVPSVSMGSPETSIKSEGLDIELGPPALPQFTPSVSKTIPSEGPLHGGIECTILGSDFTSGMTVMFGENEAYPTHCWGTNTLICLVPPAIVPGSVRVTIQGYLPTTESTSVMFTYKDDTDQAVMELALQVVGLKMTGRLDDAKQIARQIVEQNTADAQNQLNAWTSPSPTNSFSGISFNKVGFESLIANSIRSAYALKNEFEFDADLQSDASLHSLLHLACFKGYESLAEILIELGADVNIQDRNGFTPLHYAAWKGNDTLVRKLVAAGAYPDLENSNHQTPAHFASSHSRSHDNIKALLGYDISETESSDNAEDHNDVYMAGKNSGTHDIGSAPYLERTRRRSSSRAHSEQEKKSEALDYEEIDRRNKQMRSKRRQHSAIYDVPLNALSQCMPASKSDTSMYDCDTKTLQRKRDRLLYNFWIPLGLVMISFIVFSRLSVPDMEVKLPSFV